MRFLKISFLILALIGALCLIGFQVFFRMPMQARVPLLAALTARGWPMEAEELIPQPVPDEINAARYYREAFAILDGIVWEGKSYFDIIMTNRRPDVDAETKALLWEMCQGQEMSEILGKIREGTAQTACQFEHAFYVDGTIGFPGMSETLDLLTLLSMLMERQVAQGLSAEAFDTLNLQFHLAQDMQNFPLILGRLIQNAGNSLCFRSSQLYLSAFPYDESMGDSFRRWIEMMRWQKPFSETMGEELCSMMTYLEQVDSFTLFDEMYTGSDDLWESGPAFLGYPLAKPQDVNFLLEAYPKLADSLDRPYLSTRLAALEKEMDEIPDLFYISRWILPMQISYYQRTENDRIRIRLMEVALDLFDMRHRSGAFPEDLSGFEAERLLDSFSGHPFIYQKTETGFLLYSVGKDGKDGGGIRIPGGRRIDDIVWEYPVRRLEEL